MINQLFHFFFFKVCSHTTVNTVKRVDCCIVFILSVQANLFRVIQINESYVNLAKNESFHLKSVPILPLKESQICPVGAL